jgi:hypothetical protein
LGITVPFSFANGPPESLPAHLAQLKPAQVALATSFTKFSEPLVAGVKWALKSGHVVEIDVRSELKEGEEGVEELLGKVYAENPQDGEKKAIVLGAYSSYLFNITLGLTTTCPI